MSRSAGRETAPNWSPMTWPSSRAQLQAVTGERIAALEGIGEIKRETREKAVEADRPRGRQREHETVSRVGKDRERPAAAPKDREPAVPERGRDSGRDFGL